ncbi:hypothetical protein, partial [Roseivivax isoporae]|uniref:hypothetical protein n=1 Tax=Roseivivax isoporae TaxID=591206 RepID=UPI001B7FB0E3
MFRTNLSGANASNAGPSGSDRVTAGVDAPPLTKVGWAMAATGPCAVTGAVARRGALAAMAAIGLAGFGSGSALAQDQVEILNVS